MDFLIQIFRSHAVLISNAILFSVYATSVIFFVNGLWISLRALKWMRRVDTADLAEKAQEEISPKDPLALLVAKSFAVSKKKYGKNPSQLSFLADATRQMAENLFLNRYMEPLILSSNLLPPLGFIGTVFGMIMIFLAKVEPGSELNTIGLGAALFTTLLALILFVILETLKLVLSRLIKQRIEYGLFHDLERKP